MFFSIPLIGLFGLCEVVNASPVGHERVTRRQEVVPVPSSTTSGGSDGNGGQPVPMAAVIAISVVLGSGVLVLLLVGPIWPMQTTEIMLRYRCKSVNGEGDDRAATTDRRKTRHCSHSPLRIWRVHDVEIARLAVPVLAMAGRVKLSGTKEGGEVGEGG